MKKAVVVSGYFNPLHLGHLELFEKAREAKANMSDVEPEPIIYDELKKLNLSIKEVIASFKKVHPTISKYLFSGLGNTLMLVESDILTSVLLRLMGLGISALPVHDSLVFPSQYRDTVKEIMEDEYRRQIDFEITVS